jgi:glycosyltransferase involved in cell wall biosynthesis
VTRVLVCTQGFPRHEGDHHAPFILDHARALAGAGVHVTVVCPAGPGLAGREHFGDIEVVRFRYAPARLERLAYGGAMHLRARGVHGLLVPLLLIGFLIAVVREGRDADVFHAHWWLPSGLIAVVAGRLVGVATVVHVHGTDAAITRGPLRWLARAVLRQAGSVLAASRDLAGWVLDVAGVQASVAPMPLAVDRIPAPSPAPADGPVLAVGRLVPEKGFDVLVRAAALAHVRVVVVGDGGERHALEALARQTGAAVDFAGSVAPAALAHRYAAARAVAVPSRREGFGLVAAEAAAAGRAVIATSVGGLTDIVRDGVNGVLVPPDDEVALAHALREIDPRLGLAGPESVAWLRPDAIAARNLVAYEQARANARPEVGRRLLRWTGAALALLAVAFCVATLAQQWDDARRLDFSWRPVPLAGAAFCIVVANLVMAWLWGWLVRRMGGSLTWRTGMRIWWTGQLARYLPTGLGALPARLVVGARAGLARRLMLTSAGAEVLAAVLVYLAAAGLLLPVPVSVPAVALGLVVAVLGTRLVAPSGAGSFVAGHAVVLIVRSAGLWALFDLVHPAHMPSITDVVGALGLGGFVGAAALFAPGGVGVREAVLVATLSGTTGPTAAAAAAVAWRLLEVALELPIVAWSRTLRGPVVPAAD